LNLAQSGDESDSERARCEPSPEFARAIICRLRGDIDVVTARWLLVVVGACFLAACAAPHWVKPDASKSDLAQDQSVCMRTLQEPPPPGTTNEQVYEACMTAHGWTLQQRPAGKQ
jgi:hypothetical protein